MTLLDVDLNDKYDLAKTRVYITGTQALIRMCLLQSRLDRKAGLNTAGYVTGYRGSPLGGLDSQFPRARRQLTQAQVTYAPALNEDLAATALWGAQQAEMRGEGKYDGVFGIWYGKGPGVDRSGDVFRHANLAGTSRNGGVLALMGDDHTCESSTTCHQSEYALMDAMMPILNPATIGEIIDYGLHGWAISRYAGVWVGLKCVKDNVESTASILSDPDAFQSVLPVGHVLPDGGLNIRTNDSPQEQEARLHRHKLDAAKAYVRSNGLNRVVLKGGAKPRIGIVSTGKSYMDVLSTLELLNIDEAKADQLGLSLFKVAMPWPLEPEGLADFALGLEQLIVVEEKRGLMEDQIRTLLYGRNEAPRSIIGKKDENGKTLFQSELALNPMQIAEAIGRRLGAADRSVAATAEAIHGKLTEERSQFAVQRKPYFCAGCPHSSSTVLPEGARGYAGIGCHWMSQMMERRVEGYTHMGGEGANWIGESHFSTRRHMFQNMGDGTYNHSGLMAIRAAVAAKTPITFKILFNDTVAMTGGQDHDGELTPQRIAAEVKAAGVERLAFMSDRPDLYSAADFPAGTSIDHRDNIIRVQKDLSEIDGVTVLLYEQTCAAEKRRRRKRGKLEEPDRRIFINPLVCEGCGDCGQKSNCVAVLPLDTEFGRKRQIDQSSCNKDFSCVKGFCPSFVSVIGGTLRKPSASTAPLPQVPEPIPTSKLEKPYAIALTGVGGTGVVTIASLLGMAAHLEGKGSALIDMAGMAQKGGAVTSHIMLAQSPADIKAIRIAPGQANLLLGCDLVVSASDTLLKMLGPQSRLVVNMHETMTGDFTRNPDFTLHPQSLVERLAASVPAGTSTFLDSSQIARNLMGDTIAANLFMLGVAYQQGLVPVSSFAILKAIELNGVSIEFNKRSFEWGRLWAHDRSFVESQANLKPAPQQTLSLDELISRRSADLAAYQNRAYAERYRHLVEQVRHSDPHPEKLLTHAVARNGYKLMAYKDEYEVARLFTDGRFLDELGRQFTGDFKLQFHMAPPLLGDRDPATGSPQKRTFGRWLLGAMRPLAKFKALRGTAFDPFGKTSERRSERALMEDYLETMPIAANAAMDDKTYEIAVQLASIPGKIRGFGHVKEDNIKSAAALRGTLLKSLNLPAGTRRPNRKP